ncbi:MAG: FxLYD domain-containing protein [Muricomes sp.]
MALIKCPECGKEISERAGKCPNCGCPIDGTAKRETIESSPVAAVEKSVDSIKKSGKQGKKGIVIICAVIGVLIIGIVAGLIVTANPRNYSAAQKLYTSEKYQEALDKFTKLGSYKDSEQMAEKSEYALSTDGQFLNELGKGLMARWDLSEADKTEEEIYTDNTAVEIERLDSFYDKSFNDEVLGDYARQYIDLLNKAMDSLKLYTVDYSSFYNEWNSIYRQRTMLIKKIVEKYEVTMDEKHQKILDSMLKDASGAEEQENMKQEIKDMTSKFMLIPMTDEWGNTTYKVTMENTTEYTFEYFYVDINALDSDGNIIGTGNVSQVTNWAPGQKAEVGAWVDVDNVDRIASTTYTPHYQSGNFYE